MAWPTDLSQISTNLSGEEFTIVKFAIDCQLIEWGKSTIVAELCNAPFKFNGNEYELCELFEQVTKINRKE